VEPRCSECGELLHQRDLRLVTGPGAHDDSILFLPVGRDDRRPDDRRPEPASHGGRSDTPAS
jgi:hypothetical protein